MININSGFYIGSPEPIDTRMILSKAEMRSVNENILPSKYFCICSDDGQLYVFDKDSTSDETTGKFKPASNTAIEMTKAEYDMLTEDEKNNGAIYFITDEEVSSIIVYDEIQDIPLSKSTDDEGSVTYVVNSDYAAFFNQFVVKEEGKGLSTNDLTNTLLENINKVLGAENINISFIQQILSLLTGSSDEFIKDIGSEDTLDTLDFGIYRLSNNTLRSQLGIKTDAYGGMPPAAGTNFAYPGGLLFMLDFGKLKTFGSQVLYNENGSIANSTYMGFFNSQKFAIFISSSGIIQFNVYRFSGQVVENVNTPNATVINNMSWSGWKYLGLESLGNAVKQPIYRNTLTIKEEVTATSSNPLIAVLIPGTGQIAYPLKSGYLIGPNCSHLTYKSTCAGTVGSLATSITSGSPCLITSSGTFPAGTYLVEGFLS